MTAENNGVPEDDDPFAYLYRSEGDADGGAEGPAPTQPMPGVPRTSYQQATQVGGRSQYGQSGYGQQSSYGQQGGYGAQQTQAYGGYQGGVPQQGSAPGGPPAGGRAASRGSGGGSSRGVMLGAVAVVVAIAIGIGFAVFSSNGDKSNAGSGSSTSPTTTAGSNSASASSSPSVSAGLGPTDAATMKLAGTAPVTTPAGAKAAGGSSVPLSGSGQSITWTVNIPSAGSYQVWIRYGNSGADSKLDILVNGAKSREANCKNYGPEKDPTRAWFRTWVQPDLPAGQVTITLQGIDGEPPVNVDQLAITTPNAASPW
ncbi:carbohydrate-binding protein [Streptacidiphilus fuscans]|uniref:CBM6 domain-containing protein n=1 Tax=Streptacidiphilus fuscans TaxID=2789292 RepID=A0A931FFM7_9ACTN|nr:hypothetical protein [Streptacidiphilus fuscans]MBF9072211.1 hypothetical protein [Streptacidiphilus fuscans]MBF9073022.1 hypothetical protein [Streptacidiphilus fuscans]